MMISVLIPALNESQSIGDVIDLAKCCPDVSEIIVIDDGSIDGTPNLAAKKGAKVVTSTLLGKGASMEDGLHSASNDIIVYLDGDLAGLCSDLIERLVGPLLANEADFVKARFSRSSGRVTTLTAKPLMKIFFPELSGLEQPLGGVIAARRSVLESISFETDYGVDLGILVDAHCMNARIVEVDIGHLEHDSQSLETLGDMASQVVRTLFAKAVKYGRFHPERLLEVTEIERRMKAEISVIAEKIGKPRRLALIDMDGTLLDGRFVTQLAREVGKTSELSKYLDHPTLSCEGRTKAIASVFSGVAIEKFTAVAKSMKLSTGAVDFVRELRQDGYCVGIITDSYHVVADVVRRRIFADFCIANVMKFRKGIATGDITISPAMRHENGCPEHEICKRNALVNLLSKLDLDASGVVAIGDGENDICMLRAVGLGIACRPKTLGVLDAARNRGVPKLMDALPFIRSFERGLSANHACVLQPHINLESKTPQVIDH